MQRKVRPSDAVEAVERIKEEAMTHLLLIRFESSIKLVFE